MSKIFKFITISSIFIVGLLFNVSAQNSKPGEVPADTTKTSIFQGVFIEFDVAPFIETALVNKYAYSFQGNVMANLNNRFFPLVELGFAGAEKTNITNAQFKTTGMFEKIGIDFRLLKPKPNTTAKNNYLLGGVRLGMSHFTYSLNNIPIEDKYWGGSEIINENALSATKLWFEIVAGMRVPIYKDIYMGWNVRNKRLITRTKEGENAPWYIPGYGLGNTAVWGFSYVVGYRF